MMTTENLNAKNSSCMAGLEEGSGSYDSTSTEANRDQETKEMRVFPHTNMRACHTFTCYYRRDIRRRNA